MMSAGQMFGIGFAIGMIVTSIIWLAVIIIWVREQRRRADSWFRKSFVGCSETGPIP